MPAYMLLEISPALLFSAEEYDAHGRHTVLGHYTFKWRDGRMALALGLGTLSDLSALTPMGAPRSRRPIDFVSPCTGSLFNHSDSPNVTYSIDTATDSIRYTTVRAVEPDEELCIYYGPNLWFEPVGVSDGRVPTDAELVDDGWGGLAAVAGETPNRVREEDPADPNEILPDEDLPFSRVKLTSDEDDEETVEAVRTGEHIPRFAARRLMPNASTGMGSRYPRSTAYHHSTEVYITLPTLISPFHFPSTDLLPPLPLYPSISPPLNETDGSNPPALTHRPSRTSNECANPPPARTRPSSSPAHPRPYPNSRQTSTSHRRTNCRYRAAQHSRRPRSR